MFLRLKNAGIEESPPYERSLFQTARWNKVNESIDVKNPPDMTDFTLDARAEGRIE
jgi:hypothetical protein